MSEQHETMTDEEEAEVEGFDLISTTRSNIKNGGSRVASALGAVSARLDIAVPAVSSIAIKENGVK